MLMPSPEIVGAVISLITADRDDFEAELVTIVIESTYDLDCEEKNIIEKLATSGKPIEETLEDFVANGYIQKNGDKYIVTQEGRKMFKKMWVDIGAVMEACIAGGYLYYKLRKEAGLI
jgi:predicted transcriptional regulator